MCFEWCSVAVGRTESSALRGSFLYCISSSSCLRCSSTPPELQHLHLSLSSPFPHLRAASSSCPFPLHPSPDPPWCSCWLRAEPSPLQEVGAVALQRGHHHDSCTPTPPKAARMGAGNAPQAGNVAWYIPVGALGVADPQSPTFRLGSIQQNGKAGVLFRRSKRIMSSLDTN